MSPKHLFPKRRLPRIVVALFLSLALILPGSLAFGANNCQVAQGDTLWKIANQCNLQISDLIKANPQLKNADQLCAGQIICLPGNDSANCQFNFKYRLTPNNQWTNGKAKPSQPTDKWVPNKPAPSQPTPSEPTPSEPTPNEPTPSEPAPSEPTPGEQSNISSFEQQVLDLTNAERAKAGLAPLKLNTELSRVARIKSQDMRDKNYFDHNSPTYGSPFDMMRSFGIKFTAAGENIAAGQTTPQQVVQGWMNSPGHRQNILNANYNQIGIGYAAGGSYKHYWTQMFIRG